MNSKLLNPSPRVCFYAIRIILSHPGFPFPESLSLRQGKEVGMFVSKNRVMSLSLRFLICLDKTSISRQVQARRAPRLVREERENVHLSLIIKRNVRHAIAIPTKLMRVPISPKTMAIAVSGDTNQALENLSELRGQKV